MSTTSTPSAHIEVPQGFPGITGPMRAYPETAQALNELAEVLLVHETPSLSKADREIIASYVSYLNHCVFCSESHGAVADVHSKSSGLARKVWESPDLAPISDRLRALLRIAEKVQKATFPGRENVSKKDVQDARRIGANDRDIHDTVLIAAAFCMFNRYVDGLATLAPPRGDAGYQKMGQMLATVGYRNSMKAIG